MKPITIFLVTTKNLVIKNHFTAILLYISILFCLWTIVHTDDDLIESRNRNFKLFKMENIISCIQLTSNQANKVIDKYYPLHLDYNCPIDERSENNPEFVKHDMYRIQRKNLFNILTAPVGTEFVIDRKHGSNSSYIRKVGYTTIKSVNGVNNHITGFRDESCEHIDIAYAFLKSKSFGWFKSKYPL